MMTSCNVGLTSDFVLVHEEAAVCVWGGDVGAVREARKSVKEPAHLEACNLLISQS